MQKDDALAKLVPSGHRVRRQDRRGSDASYAPNEFVDTDGTTIIGMDVDLGKAIGQKLGLEVEFQNSAFDGILPGIAAKKYELGMSSFTDNAEREKVVDMVSYFSAGTKMAVVKGNPDGLNIDDLCGKTIAVQRGTVQVDDLTARSDKCTAAGKPAITSRRSRPRPTSRWPLTRQAGPRHARRLAGRRLRRGDRRTVSWRSSARPTTPRRTASPCPRTSGDYAKAVQGAVQALMTDGTYKAILDKWSVSVRRDHRRPRSTARRADRVVAEQTDAGPAPPIKAVPVRHPGPLGRGRRDRACWSRCWCTRS